MIADVPGIGSSKSNTNSVVSTEQNNQRSVEEILPFAMVGGLLSAIIRYYF